MRTSSFAVSLSFVLCVACGGATASPGDSKPAPDPSGTGTGSAPPAPPSTPTTPGNPSTPTSGCHGFCPQPDGATCQSDCDCENKCLSGTDKAPRCAAPLVADVACSEVAGCPSGQSCGPFGFCQGASCGSNDDCPSKQQCVGKVCQAVGCL